MDKIKLRIFSSLA